MDSLVELFKVREIQVGDLTFDTSRWREAFRTFLDQTDQQETNLGPVTLVLKDGLYEAYFLPEVQDDSDFPEGVTWLSAERLQKEVEKSLAHFIEVSSVHVLYINFSPGFVCLWETDGELRINCGALPTKEEYFAGETWW